MPYNIVILRTFMLCFLGFLSICIIPMSSNAEISMTTSDSFSFIWAPTHCSYFPPFDQLDRTATLRLKKFNEPGKLKSLVYQVRVYTLRNQIANVGKPKGDICLDDYFNVIDGMGNFVLSTPHLTLNTVVVMDEINYPQDGIHLGFNYDCMVGPCSWHKDWDAQFISPITPVTDTTILSEFSGSGNIDVNFSINLGCSAGAGGEDNCPCPIPVLQCYHAPLFIDYGSTDPTFNFTTTTNWGVSAKITYYYEPETAGGGPEIIPPVAAPGGPYYGFVGVPIEFDASGSYLAMGYWGSLQWDWNNDGIYDYVHFFPSGYLGGLPKVAHTFNSEYIGEVRLYVSESGGINSEDTAYVVVKAAPIVGDLDGDGDVDQNDVNIILNYRNQPASACPACDIDGDGMVTGLDARKLVLLCTRPRCATQ
jgi:hypothetical protein